MSRGHGGMAGSRSLHNSFAVIFGASNSRMLMRLMVLLPNVLFAAFAAQAILKDFMPDLFIYREGARLGWAGDSPYSSRITDAVRQKYPADEELQRNCGYFLPPQAIVLFGPFAAVPWETAKLLYAVLCLFSVGLCWYGLTFAFRGLAPPAIEKVPIILPWLVCLHPVLWIGFNVGQTTILAAGAIVLGQIVHTRGWRWLGALLWASAFVKPHVALPLLPLAWYLNGWKRPAMIVVWLAVLNLAGCLLAAGTPMFAFDYLHHLGDNHKLVNFNRVEWNAQIVSWNRVLFSLGGPAIDLSLTGTLIGYAIATLLIVLRCALAKCWPSPAWALAAGMSAAMVCCQVLAYEAWLLVLVIPLILECLAAGQRRTAFIMIAMLTLQTLPFFPVVDATLKLHAMTGQDWLVPLLTSYRAWLVLGLALTILGARFTSSTS